MAPIRIPSSAQLALVPHVAPAGIVPRKPHDDGAELGIEGRATDLRNPGMSTCVLPARGANAAGSGGVTRKDDQRSRGSRRAAAARKARSIGRSCGRLARRRRTRSGWCRTAISTSLDTSWEDEPVARLSRRRITRYKIEKAAGGDPTEITCSGCKTQFWHPSGDPESVLRR